jgi:hypothetical protein
MILKLVPRDRRARAVQAGCGRWARRVILKMKTFSHASEQEVLPVSSISPAIGM